MTLITAKILSNAKSVATKVNVMTEFEMKRVRKKKRLPGELCQDETGNIDIVTQFKLNVLWDVIDTMCNQITDRFTKTK